MSIQVDFWTSQNLWNVIEYKLESTHCENESIHLWHWFKSTDSFCFSILHLMHFPCINQCRLQSRPACLTLTMNCLYANWNWINWILCVFRFSFFCFFFYFSNNDIMFRMIIVNYFVWLVRHIQLTYYYGSYM